MPGENGQPAVSMQRSGCGLSSLITEPGIVMERGWPLIAARAALEGRDLGAHASSAQKRSRRPREVG